MPDKVVSVAGGERGRVSTASAGIRQRADMWQRTAQPLLSRQDRFCAV